MASTQPIPKLPDCSAVCRQIQAASSEGEIIEAVRGYLSSIDGSSISALPVSLLSLQASQARDIAAAAVELARREATIAHDAPEAALLRDVTKVLSTAAMRIALVGMQPGAAA